jgi:hypothetical protein
MDICLEKIARCGVSSLNQCHKLQFSNLAVGGCRRPTCFEEAIHFFVNGLALQLPSFKFVLRHWMLPQIQFGLLHLLIATHIVVEQVGRCHSRRGVRVHPRGRSVAQPSHAHPASPPKSVTYNSPRRFRYTPRFSAPPAHSTTLISQA